MKTRECCLLGWPEVRPCLAWDRIAALEREIEQRRVVNRKPPEDGHAGLDEVGRRVLARWQRADPGAEHHERPVCERGDQSVLGAEQAVDRARGRLRLLGDPPQRQAIRPVRLDHPLGRVEQRLGGLLVVHFPAAHLDSILQYRYVTTYRYGVPKPGRAPKGATMNNRVPQPGPASARAGETSGLAAAGPALARPAGPGGQPRRGPF